jgi:hypothetical protein
MGIWIFISPMGLLILILILQSLQNNSTSKSQDLSMSAVDILWCLGLCATGVSLVISLVEGRSLVLPVILGMITFALFIPLMMSLWNSRSQKSFLYRLYIKPRSSHEREEAVKTLNSEKMCGHIIIEYSHGGFIWENDHQKRFEDAKQALKRLGIAYESSKKRLW